MHKMLTFRVATDFPFSNSLIFPDIFPSNSLIFPDFSQIFAALFNHIVQFGNCHILVITVCMTRNCYSVTGAHRKKARLKVILIISGCPAEASEKIAQFIVH